MNTLTDVPFTPFAPLPVIAPSFQLFSPCRFRLPFCSHPHLISTTFRHSARCCILELGHYVFSCPKHSNPNLSVNTPDKIVLESVYLHTTRSPSLIRLPLFSSFS
ncbi:unnamed protein product, partial [Dicrocoelium dendriticum]